MFKNMFKYWGVNPELPVPPKVEHKWSSWEDTEVKESIATSTPYGYTDTKIVTVTLDGITKQRRRCTVCNKIQRDDELNNKEATQCLN